MSTDLALPPDQAQALLRILSLSFEGAGTYRQRVGPLNFSKRGRVLLCGPEGSGKSMIPEVMTLILQGRGSPRVRTSGLVESSIVNEITGYCGTLEFESGFGAASQHVEITQAFKHKRMGSKYTIHINGQQDETTGKPAQKKLVKRLAPLSLGEWLGVVYLHQGGIHDLLAGSPTEKKEYLTSVFGLDFYDDLVTVAKDELKGFYTLVAGAWELEQRLQDLQEDARKQESILASVPGGIAEVEAGIEKLGTKLQSLSKKLGSIEAAQTSATSYKSVLDEIDEARAELGKKSLSAAEAKTQLKQERTQHTTKVQRIAEDETVLKGLQKRHAAYSKLQHSLKEAKKELDEAEKAHAKLAADIGDTPDAETLGRLNKLIVSAQPFFVQKTVIDRSVKSKKLKRPWKEAAKERDSLLVTADKLRKVLDKGHQSCPTCLQGMDTAVFKATLVTTEKQAQACHGEALSGFILELDAVTPWWPNDPPFTLSDLGASVDAAIVAREELEEAAETVEEARSEVRGIEEDLGEAEVPQSPEKLAQDVAAAKAELEQADGLIESLDSLVKLFGQAEALESSVKGLDLEALEQEAEELAAKKAKAKARYDQALAIKTRYDEAAATLRAINKQIESTVKKLEEHAETALKIKHYEQTLIPYFNTLRAGKVHSCVSVLEGVLPVYVGAMAASQYVGAEVRLEVSEDLKKVDLLLQPRVGSPWLSAIQASGGQRRRFTLATIAALREVSPRKANLMFFDEPFADLESEGKMLFVNRLVPTLLDRCADLESIFVIAHDHEVLESANDAFDSVWTAECDQLGSRLLIDQRLALVEGR